MPLSFSDPISSLHIVGALVRNQLQRTPLATRVSYWHQAVLHLFHYICLQKI